MQPPLMETLIQSTGKLRSRHQPALYLDPSFFTGYVAATAVAAGGQRADLAATLPPVYAGDATAFVAIAARIREGTLGFTPVVSSLTLLRWMQQQVPAFHAGNRDARYHFADMADGDLEDLRYQGWLQQLAADALAGVLQVDLHGFSLTVEEAWEEVPALALIDGAERSLLHALAARHLGCTHLATMETSMGRICQLLQGSGAPEPLIGPERVLVAAPPPPPHAID